MIWRARRSRQQPPRRAVDRFMKLDANQMSGDKRRLAVFPEVQGTPFSILQRANNGVRRRMRAFTLLSLLFLWPALAVADIRWQKFFVGGEGDRQSLKIGHVALTFRTREVRNADFKEDHLVMTVHIADQKPEDYWLDSSYGEGEVAIDGDLLLLKYGGGRGTFARVEHVRALRLLTLEELVDVQSSYYVLSDRKEADPDLVRYSVKVQVDRHYTTLSFTLPKRQRGIPSEKIVRLKNDG
jgi:hypothetical protein